MENLDESPGVLPALHEDDGIVAVVYEATGLGDLQLPDEGYPA